MSGIYKSDYSAQLLKILDERANINNAYELANGSEKEFNNAARFLKYATLKDSEVLYNNENELSTFFGKMLEKYYDSYLTNEDIANILQHIVEYNTYIHSLYDINSITSNEKRPDNNGAVEIIDFGKDENLKNIIKDIIGLDIDNFNISQFSPAETIYNILKAYYLNVFGRVLNSEAFYKSKDDTPNTGNHKEYYKEITIPYPFIGGFIDGTTYYEKSYIETEDSNPKLNKTYYTRDASSNEYVKSQIDYYELSFIETEDVEKLDGKTYYTYDNDTYTSIGDGPFTPGVTYYEEYYILTGDSDPESDKTYYTYNSNIYTSIDGIDIIFTPNKEYYEECYILTKDKTPQTNKQYFTMEKVFVKLTGYFLDPFYKLGNRERYNYNNDAEIYEESNIGIYKYYNFNTSNGIREYRIFVNAYIRQLSTLKDLDDNTLESYNITKTQVNELYTLFTTMNNIATIISLSYSDRYDNSKYSLYELHKYNYFVTKDTVKNISKRYYTLNSDTYVEYSGATFEADQIYYERKLNTFYQYVQADIYGNTKNTVSYFKTKDKTPKTGKHYYIKNANGSYSNYSGSTFNKDTEYYEEVAYSESDYDPNILPKPYIYQEYPKESLNLPIHPATLYYLNTSIEAVSFGEFEDKFIKLVMDILITKIMGKRNCCYGNIKLKKNINNVATDGELIETGVYNQKYNILQYVGVDSINSEYNNIVVGHGTDILLNEITNESYNKLKNNDIKIVLCEDGVESRTKHITVNRNNFIIKSEGNKSIGNYLLIKLNSAKFTEFIQTGSSLVQAGEKLIFDKILEWRNNNVENVPLTLKVKCDGVTVGDPISIDSIINIQNKLFDYNNVEYFHMFYNIAINAFRTVAPQEFGGILKINTKTNTYTFDEQFIYDYFVPIYVKLVAFRENIVAGCSIGDISVDEKRSANGIEAAMVAKYKNLAYIKLENITVEYNASNPTPTSMAILKYALMMNPDEFGVKDAETNEYVLNPELISAIIDGDTRKKTIISLNIALLYKELNPIIRDISSSFISESVMAEIYYTKYAALSDQSNTIEINKTIIDTTNESLYDMLYQQPTKSNNMYKYFGDVDNGGGNMIYRYFYSIKTNPYTIRKSTVNSIISFYSGTYFGYGDTLNDNDEIETILKLFSEVREYFYKVLFNNAFLKTDLYNLFIKFYLKSYTIERFMTSKIDNLRNIDKYSLEDCKNFFISYGLSELHEQISQANFTMALTYCRRIIAKYTDLMSKKGSRAVIDEFIKIFDFSSTDIDIFKYLLIKINNDDKSSDLKFIRVPYQTENIVYSLKQNKNNVTSYTDFIQDDIYWDNEDVPENTVKDLMAGPVNTKYLGIKLTKKIYEDFIRSKYNISAMYEIYKAITKLPPMYKNNILNNFKVKSSDGSEYSLLQLYLRILLAYDRYTELMECKYDMKQKTGNGAFYRINIQEDILKNFIQENGLVDIMSTPILCKKDTEIVGDNSVNIVEYLNDFYYYIKSNNLTPFLLKNGNRTILAPDRIQLSDTNIAFPLASYLTANDNVTFKNYIDFCIRYNAKSVTSRGTSIYKDHSQISNAYKSHTLLDDALTSLSILNALTYNAENEDMHKDLFTAMMYFEGYKTSDSAYQSTNDLQTDVAINAYLYNALFEGIINFPVKYLMGSYKNGDIVLTKNTSDMLDKIFNTFFTSNESLLESEFIKINNEDADFSLSSNKYFKYADTNDRGKVYEYITSTYEGDIYESKIVNLAFPGNIDEDFNKIYNTPNQDQNIENCEELLIKYISSLNEIISVYDDMKVKIDFLEDSNNILEFIKIAIKNFISYTSMLYQSELSYKIDTANERSHIIDTIKSEILINNSLEDYCYVDETITIKDIT